MTAAVLWISIASVALRPVFAFAQPRAGQPVKVEICEIARHPETYDGKLIQARALVETGLQDLPAALVDESCAAELKFYLPGDSHLSLLVKSKGFQKLVKAVKKNPVVQATVAGLFMRQVPDHKSESGLVLESVADIAIVPQPRVKAQKR